MYIIYIYIQNIKANDRGKWIKRLVNPVWQANASVCSPSGHGRSSPSVSPTVNRGEIRVVV